MISGVFCQKQVSWAWTGNYIPHMLRGLICCLCPRCLVLTQHSSIRAGFYGNTYWFCSHPVCSIFPDVMENIHTQWFLIATRLLPKAFHLCIIIISTNHFYIFHLGKNVAPPMIIWVWAVLKDNTIDFECLLELSKRYSVYHYYDLTLDMYILQFSERH